MKFNTKIAENVFELSILNLKKISDGSNLDIIIDDLRSSDCGKIVADLLFNYFRNKSHIDYIIDHINNLGKKRKKTSNKIKRILSVALVQLLYQTGIAKHTSVDVSVAYTKKKYGKSVAGYVNAVLRKALLLNLEEIFNDAKQYVKFNLSEIIYKQWTKYFTEEEIANFAKIISQRSNIRFRLVGNISEAELLNVKCKLIEMPDWGSEYIFYEAMNPNLLFQQNWLEKGLIYIQDISTLSPCLLYQSKENDIVYDLCSAPGGKSVLLAQRMKTGTIIASDSSYHRQKRTLENFNNAEKLQSINKIVLVSSALNPALSEQSADCILLDVPCSNTGVIRKRPDVIWNFTTKKFRELQKIQREMLEKAAPLVKIGGQLIYSTCSIEQEENSLQIQGFLQEFPQFKLEKERILLPCELHDGSYAALLTRI